MADNTLLNNGTGGDTIATDDLTTLNGGAVTGVKVQRMKVGFGTDATLRDVDLSNPLPITSTFQSNQTGTWGYNAGVSGTLTLTGGKKLIGIAAHATAAGSMTINSGDSIPIPANVGIQFSPVGSLVNPTIVFTGTDSYVAEYIT